MPMVVSAPAKVNLYLAIGAPLPDGHHSVTTVLVALDLADLVTVEPAAALSLTCDPDVGVASSDNLGWRAAVAMGKAFDRSPDFAIHIEKRVPAGAGLAGGSADAAAVIAAVAAAWDVQPDDYRLSAVASAVGADVAFALRGGCGLYGGRGATFRRALRPPKAHFAIITGPKPVSTAAAYIAFDRIGRTPAPGPKRVTSALCLEELPELGAALFNNMTAAAVSLVPAVGDALAFMAAAEGCCGSAVCGSGSAVFGLFADAAQAQEAADAARERGMWAVVAAPIAAGTLEQTMGVSRDGR